MNGRQLVAWNLRRLRVLRGQSQEKLGLDAGVDRSYVGRLERAQENPTVDVLERLARALAVPIAHLLNPARSGDTAPKPLRAGRKPKTRSVRRRA